MMKIILVFILGLSALIAEDLIDKSKLWKPIIEKIDYISNNKTTIKKANLKVGQSGVVLHVYENNNKIIVSNAKVISSNDKESIVEFMPFNDLKQASIPKSNRKVATNDILILNYLYTSSMIIAPNQESFLMVRNKFKYNNFLHPDLFATNLKINTNPFPTKIDIQNFAVSQNLGTVFLVLKNNLYIFDTKTFKLLEKLSFKYTKKDMQKPFYSRIDEIESGTFDFDLANVESLNYDEYFIETLGLK